MGIRKRGRPRRCNGKKKTGRNRKEKEAVAAVGNGKHI